MELLVFLNMDENGVKPILQERILKYLKTKIRLNAPLPEGFGLKIDELNE